MTDSQADAIAEAAVAYVEASDRAKETNRALSRVGFWDWDVGCWQGIRGDARDLERQHQAAIAKKSGARRRLNHLVRSLNE